MAQDDRPADVHTETVWEGVRTLTARTDRGEQGMARAADSTAFARRLVAHGRPSANV